MAKRSDAGQHGPYWLERSFLGGHSIDGYTKVSDARKEILATLQDIDKKLRVMGFAEEADWRIGDAILRTKGLQVLYPGETFDLSIRTSFGRFEVRLSYSKKEGQ